MFAERLKQARNAKKLNQRTIAGYLDIPHNVYRSYELGEREPPYDVLVKLCKLLNVSADCLLDLSDEPSRR